MWWQHDHLVDPLQVGPISQRCASAHLSGRAVSHAVSLLFGSLVDGVQRGGRSFGWRDFNFVPSGKGRMGGEGETAYSNDRIALPLRICVLCLLLWGRLQHDCTFRRLARDTAGPSVFPALVILI